MGDVPNWLFSTCTFFGFLLCAIPLPWHLEAWNTGTCLYMIWTGLGCLNQFINSVVWRSDDINRAPVWCDISTKYIMGLAVAIPACSLCINRRLYHIVSVDSVTKTRAEKRRDILIDLAIGIGIPVIEMILHYIPQNNRFNIYEGIGCWPATSNTIPAYALVYTWPIAIGVVSAYYCIRTIRELAVRRAQFKELLSVNANISSGRYFRLMGLAGIEVLCTVPLASYALSLNLQAQPIQPWVSWSWIHTDFSAVYQISWDEWHSSQAVVVGLRVAQWFSPICAFVFFAFFGFADEARKNYRLAYQSVAKRVGLSTGAITTGTWSATGSKPDASYNGRSGTMPIFITQRTSCKRGSLASFSTNVSIGDFGGSLSDLKEKQPLPMAVSGGSISKESLPISSPTDASLPALPEPSLNIDAVPRYIPDAPQSRRTSLDV